MEGGSPPPPDNQDPGEVVMKDEDSTKETGEVVMKGTGEVVMKDEDSTKETGEVVMKDEDSTKAEAKEASQEVEDTPEKKTVARPRQSTEPEIGITEYLGKHKGFFGILKQRYSDFIVNEVTSSGEVVHLTDRKIPAVPEVAAEMPNDMPPELTASVTQQLDDLAGIPRPAHIPVVPCPKESEDGGGDTKKDVSETSKLDQNVSQVEKGLDEVWINVNGVTKDGRTNIHKAVKAKYNSVVSFYKENDDGNKFIIIQKKKASGHSTGIPKRSSWPKGEMYTTFVLYKENIDTMDAINHISRRAGVKPNMFAYAGTKDRRGKTSQLVSVPRVAPERLCQAANFRPIHLGNFRFLPTPQKLGQLRGNKFHIVLREVKEDDEVILASIESLKTNGFINYFGSQRFGTTSISTHSIGLELLKSNWQKAVDLILAPRDNDNPVLNKCRLVWKETANAEEALRVLRGDKDSTIEGKLLSGLKELKKNDLVGALGSLPRNMRVLYLHAYQSYIWNKVVSRRIAKYGLTVLPGDIIRRKDSEIVKNEDSVDPEDEEENTQNGDGDTDQNKEKEKSGIDMSNFHILSEEEAKTTSITDVLLPLPGHRIEYPQNEVKSWYIELLEADGLSIAALNHRVKCYSVIGSYRRIIVQMSDISSAITYYDDPTKPLIQSDMDILLSEPVDGNLLEEGKNKAVIIEMTLPTSSYATMALRELLKMDTSSAFQATLNTTFPSANPRPAWGNGSNEGRHFREDGGRNEHRGRGNRGFHGDRRGGFRGNSRGRGEKRPWRGGSQGRGGKRGRFSKKF